MDKTLKRNNPMQNAIAFSYLLDNGRLNILNEKFYNNEIKKLEHDNSDFMSPGFKKEILEIARYMAEMEEKDLRNYIFDRVKEERKREISR